MLKTLELFVGSNNTTLRVERDKLIRTLEKRHKGFTVLPARGHWEGMSEESVAVLIHDEVDTIMDTISDLKATLKQDAIAFHEVSPLEFV